LIGTVVGMTPNKRFDTCSESDSAPGFG
jgi:hypothetical protein